MTQAEAEISRGAFRSFIPCQSFQCSRARKLFSLVPCGLKNHTVNPHCSESDAKKSCSLSVQFKSALGKWRVSETSLQPAGLSPSFTQFFSRSQNTPVKGGRMHGTSALKLSLKGHFGFSKLQPPDRPSRHRHGRRNKLPLHGK